MEVSGQFLTCIINPYPVRYFKGTVLVLLRSKKVFPYCRDCSMIRKKVHRQKLVYEGVYYYIRSSVVM